MKNIFSIATCFLIFLSLVLTFSCSHQQSQTTSIASANLGLMKNHLSPFPIYLTDKLENRLPIEKKYSKDTFIIFIGHLLKPEFSKSENEKILSSLSELGINLVNLTLEDFVIADAQGISLENYNQIFLNSTVIDINQDSLIKANNIVPYFIYDGIAFIGLSDSKMNKDLNQEKYLISDYVLSILRVKKSILKASRGSNINSFILIHNLGPEISEVMDRLPPSFINSLTNK